MATKSKHKASSKPGKPASNGLVKQGAKFGVVGISNTLIDFTIFNVVTSLLGVPPAQFFVVKFFSGSAAMVNSFYWNRRWTFHSKAKLGESGLKFVVATLVSVYAIQPGMVYLFSATSWGQSFGTFWFLVFHFLGITDLVPHVLTTNFFIKNVAFAFGVLGSAVWNFTLYKLWAFKK
jgi:putative flippase GtrA